MSTASEHIRAIGGTITITPTVQALVAVPVDVHLFEYDCHACRDLGALGTDPETGERIYCHECVYGINLHLNALSDALGRDAEWLARYDGHGWEANDTRAAVQAHFDEACELHDELSAKHAALRQDEIGRPRARLFEAF